MNEQTKRIRDTQDMLKTIGLGLLEEYLRTRDPESRANIEIARLRLEEASALLGLVEHRHLTDNFSPRANPPGTRITTAGPLVFMPERRTGVAAQPAIDNANVATGCEQFSPPQKEDEAPRASWPTGEYPYSP